mgnify:CR=1 FL=1
MDGLKTYSSRPESISYELRSHPCRVQAYKFLPEEEGGRVALVWQPTDGSNSKVYYQGK